MVGYNKMIYYLSSFINRILDIKYKKTDYHYESRFFLVAEARFELTTFGL